ncbi:uncharacterized protein [Panulirus ornatus]|uniref:uncharacterized protein isoform X2 n=1 Tax=Panulirus ornatus TaxID=150431 RepID=UPI003A89564C
MATKEKCEWLRPASKAEVIYDVAQKKNMLLTSYLVTLSSAAPLQEDHVRKALVHLYRKVPTLRMCFRLREGTIWACEVDCEIDFQVIEATDPLKVMEDMLGKGFNSSKGPLWRARLVRAREGIQCPMPELQAAFPYTRSLVLANHHGIADGTSNLKIVDLFLQILDDVIEGKTVNDEEQLGESEAGVETEKLLSAVEAELEQDPEYLQSLLNEARNENKEPILTVQAYPPPEGVEVKTKVMIKDLDKNTTKDFLKRCKDEGVTVHSGFTALLNGSIVDILEETGMKQEAYHIKELHTVNMRRYWPGDTSRALGCHISLLANHDKIAASWRDNFWEYARTVHQSLHKSIKEKAPIEELHILWKLIGDAPEEAFSGELIPEHEYVTANLRNADWLVPTDGKHVRLTHLVRATSIWKDCWLHMFHTFRGRFLYCLCYSAHIVAEETASHFLDQIFKNLKSVI